MTILQRRLRAALLASLVVLSGFTVLGSSASALEDRTPVLVVRALSSTGSGSDAFPLLVVDELEGLLESGGLTNVREVEASSASGLLRALREAEAVHLVVVGHGAPEGLAVGEDVVAWAALRDALAQSRASFVYLGACHSAAVGEIEGKTVATAFQGEVDRRIVAPQIASDMFAGAFPRLDPAFERVLYAHVLENGGLDAYARLILLPEEPLQASADHCKDLMKSWYDGAHPASAGECIFYLDPENLNCHSADARGTDACVYSSAAEQEALNRDSASSASASESDGADAGAGSDEFSVSWWSTMKRHFGARLHTDAGTVTATTGPGAGCVTIVKLEHLQAGGLTFALQAFLREVRSRFGSAEDSPVGASADASILALRLCGSVRVSAGMTQDGETRFGAAGDFDARVSMYFTAEVNVFKRWTKQVSFEAGVKYPAKVGLEGRLSPCRSGNATALAARIVAPIEAGSAGLFIQSKAGWASLGAQYDFGAKRDFTIESVTRCPDGWSPYASVEPTDETLARLVSSGLAVVNPAPTLLGEDGLTQHRVQNGFLVLEPGTATWRGYAADGTLGRLGVPADLPPTAQVVLDATDPGVLRALGRDVTDLPVPLVSLVGGVVVLPRGTPTAASEELFCEGDVTDGAGVLHASACAGLFTGPIPQPYVDASWSLAAPQESLPLPDPSPYHEEANDAVALACDALPLFAPICAEGRSTTTAASAAPGGLDLLTAIHGTFQILERPGFAQWLVTTCRAEPVPGDTSGRASTGDFVPMVYPDGSVGMGEVQTSACMEVGEYVAPRQLNAREVADQLVLGNVMLGVFASDAHSRAASAFSDGEGPLPDVVGKLDPVFEALSETECELINVCPEASS